MNFSTLSLLMTSLVLALVAARPQFILPNLLRFTPSAPTASESSDSTNSQVSVVSPFKFSTMKPIPAKTFAKGGAVIELPDGLVLKAGSTASHSRGDEENSVSYNSDGINNIVSGSLQQAGSEYGYAPTYPASAPADGSQPLVYQVNPGGQQVNDPRSPVYVFVPVNTSSTAKPTMSRNNKAKLEQENNNGILKFVPPTLKRFFSHLITTRKSFHFFNIFVNSNLYSGAK